MSLLPIPTTNLLDFSEELLLHIISFLSAKDLKITEKVCGLLRRISQDNLQWKSIHCKKFNITAQWIGPSPIVWRTYSEKVEKASRGWQFSTVDELRYSKFWKMGFLNEYLGMRKPQDLPSPFLAYAIAGEHKKALDMVANESQVDVIKWGITQILIMLDQRRFKEALDEFRELRLVCTPRDHVWLWWLSRLIDISLRLNRSSVVFPRESQIKLSHSPDPTTLTDFQGILFGCYATWLAKRDFERAQITLECLERTRPSWTTRFAPLTEDLFLQTTYPLHLNSSASLWLNYAETTLHFSPYDKEGCLHRVACAYGEALKLTATRRIHTRMCIASKLAETLDSLASNPKEKQEIQWASHLVTVLKESIEKNLSFTPLDIADMIDAICTYKLEAAYVYFLENIKIKNFNKLSDKNFIKVHFNLLHLCCLTERFEQAVDIWVNLSLFASQKSRESQKTLSDPYTKETMYEKICEVLAQSLPACQRLLSVYGHMRHRAIILALAAAYFQLERDKEGIGILINSTTIYDFQVIKPLLPIIQRKFTALIAYSLYITTLYELKSHYNTLLHRYPDHQFLIHHNLAVRLFFLGYPAQASDTLLVALETNEEEAESYALQSMIYQSLGKKEWAQEALKKAHALNEEFILEKTDYPELQLLITPKDPL